MLEMLRTAAGCMVMGVSAYLRLPLALPGAQSLVFCAVRKMLVSYKTLASMRAREKNRLLCTSGDCEAARLRAYIQFITSRNLSQF